MREDVLIVLNEREPLKQRLAEELEESLLRRRYSCARLAPTLDLENIIQLRHPRVLVLDYLLGDFATALDLLHSFSGRMNNMQTVIWTDESSVNAAVAAMKLGAADYIEIGLSQSPDRVSASVDTLLKGETAFRPRPAYGNFPAPCSGKACAEASALANRCVPVVAILGAQGTGRSMLARFMHYRRPFSGELFELELDLWPHSLHTVFRKEEGTEPLLSCSSTVHIDHIDFDRGKLLELAAEWVRKQSAPGQARPQLIAGMENETLARLWQRECEAEIIELPPLSKRKQDFALLLDRFQSHLPRKKRTTFSSEIITAIADLSWPGNIRQFKAAAFEALALMPTAGQELTPAAELHRARDTVSDAQEKLFFDLLSSAKKRWERGQQQQPRVPALAEARSAVKRFQGDLRLAALHLATGIPQLRAVLGEEYKDDCQG